MERRASPRASTSISASCRVPATPQKATVLDLSTTGCRAAVANCHAAIGSTMQVDLRPGLTVSGVVVWSAGNRVGIRFQRRLTTAQAIDLGIQMGPATPVCLNHITPKASRGLQHWIRTAFGMKERNGK